MSCRTFRVSMGRSATRQQALPCGLWPMAYGLRCMGKLDVLDATTPQQQLGPYVSVVVAELMYSIRLR